MIAVGKHVMESVTTIYTKSNTCDGKVGAKTEYSVREGVQGK